MKLCAELNDYNNYDNAAYYARKKLERRKNSRKIYGSNFVGVVGGDVLKFLGV